MSRLVSQRAVGWKPTLRALALVAPLALAACAAPRITDPLEQQAQAHMIRLEGASQTNLFAQSISACVVSNATEAELRAILAAQSQAQMDVAVARIIDTPEFGTCIGG